MIALLIIVGVFGLLAYYFIACMIYEYWCNIFHDKNVYDDTEGAAFLMAIAWPVSWLIRLICQWLVALANFAGSLGKKLSKAGNK